jgi:hypothetical protein
MGILFLLASMAGAFAFDLPLMEVNNLEPTEVLVIGDTYVKSGNIMKAKIFILPKYARKARVLEHEVGHALGWKHYPQKFHIMHPTWQLSGYESRGLKKR